jgi:dTDP-4-dehydrorhamnose 3,5-epimerase
MRFIETELKGAWIVEPERMEDKRGYFARTFCREEFAANALETAFVQASLSFNRCRGTLRGMHYQAVPHAETKLVSCTRGAIFDVIVDLRKDSPTFLKYAGFPLDAESKATLYIPKEFAHGFLTLEDDTEVCYQMTSFHAPQYACGFRWNDPVVDIDWPSDPGVISERDASYEDFDPTKLRP